MKNCPNFDIYQIKNTGDIPYIAPLNWTKDKYCEALIHFHKLALDENNGGLAEFFKKKIEEVKGE